MDNSLESLARLLVNRLERLSADSRWAHRASGLRGELLRALDETGDAVNQSATDRTMLIDRLVRRGFLILESAAREMGDYS